MRPGPGPVGAKTAPKAGLSMLSGVSTQEAAVSLRDRLSTGELIRIFEDPAANCRRIHPGWKKPVGWGAVLNSPLRTGLKPGTGGHKRPPHPAGGSSCLRSQADQQRPRRRKKRALPARRSGKPPGDFRRRKPYLRMHLWASGLTWRPGCGGELVPPVSGFFTSTPDAPVQGALRNGCLELQCVNSFVHDMVNKPEILQRIAQCASGMLGHQCVSWL